MAQDRMEFCARRRLDLANFHVKVMEMDEHPGDLHIFGLNESYRVEARHGQTLPRRALVVWLSKLSGAAPGWEKLDASFHYVSKSWRPRVFMYFHQRGLKCDESI